MSATTTGRYVPTVVAASAKPSVGTASRAWVAPEVRRPLRSGRRSGGRVAAMAERTEPLGRRADARWMAGASVLWENAAMAFLYRLRPPRPTFAEDMSSAEADVMQGHVAYWQDLLNRDVAVAFGPVLDPEGPWGLGLLDVDDGQAARAIGEDDPAVQTGTCTYELVPMELVRPG